MKLTIFNSVENPVFIEDTSSESMVKDLSHEISSLESQVDSMGCTLTVVLVSVAVPSSIFLARKFGLFTKMTAFVQTIRNKLRPTRAEVPVTVVLKPCTEENVSNDAVIPNCEGETSQANTTEELAAPEDPKPLAIEVANEGFATPKVKSEGVCFNLSFCEFNI